MKDSRSLPTAERLVGIDPDGDFPNAFGKIAASNVEPAVIWWFRQTALVLPSGRHIHIVQIPASSRGPHAVLDESRFWFCKRTSQGTVAMQFGDVQTAFQATETRQAKLALLLQELAHSNWVAERLLGEVEPVPQVGLSEIVWTTRYQTGLLDAVYAEAYSLLLGKTDILAAITMLRDETRRANEFAAVYANHQFLEEQAKNPVLRAKLEQGMQHFARRIRENVRHARKMVISAKNWRDGLRFDPERGDDFSLRMANELKRFETQSEKVDE